MSSVHSTKKSSRIQTPNSENVLVPREKDFRNAKSFLLKAADQCSISMYDFLVLVIRRLYEDRDKLKPINIEETCRSVKRELYLHKPGTLKPVRTMSKELSLAHAERHLFEQHKFSEHLTDEDAGELTKLPNLIQTFYYFEQAGIGMNREEIIRLWLSMKQLLESGDSGSLENVRFWGKLFGTERNYYVLEADMAEKETDYKDEVDAETETRQQLEQDMTRRAQEEVQQEVEDENKEIVDEPPKAEWKTPPIVPFEVNGVGVNRKVYFVCNVLGEAWIRLPKVTPEQIQISRLIKRYLTGRLDARIESYPPFPGHETNLLRALISRISAATLISPLGFYTFDEEEEEAAEETEEGGEAGRSRFVEDSEWEPVPLRDLLDPSFANWVHHAQYILQQGRTSWWNPASNKAEEMEEEAEEEDEREEMDEPEPESGPPLLTPINEDEEMPGGVLPWSAKLSSYLAPQFGVAVISSNRWPGAHAFATGRTFDNVYIGWGDKYIPPNLSPLALSGVMTEFPSSAEITEIDDPSPDEEAAFRAAQAQAAEAAEENEEEGGEEEGEEEEEDDD